MTWKTDIQANILRGLPAWRAEYRFVRFPSCDDLQSFTRRVLPHVRDAAWQRNRFPAKTRMGHAVLNLAFTRQGIELAAGTGGYQPDDLRRDELDESQLVSRTSDGFASTPIEPGETTIDDRPTEPTVEKTPNSMFRRLDVLGESPGASWLDAWKTEEIHALAWISGPADGVPPIGGPTVDRLTAKVIDGSHGDVEEISALAMSGIRDENSLGPFGFKDGVSQPAVAGFHTEREIIGRGAWTGRGWRGLAPGEFIVGEVDEGGERRRPLPADILHNCTYLVFRDLEMFPERLYELQDEYGERFGVAPETIGEWFVGRHRPGDGNAGTSLMVDGPAEDLDFVYGFDPEGLRCPLGAHIRRANPRDMLGREGQRANRHRIIRRGMPSYQPGTRNPIGLAFIALQA
ncbi:MAG: hypothetical protein OEV40_16420, partial [Acidimicrobiia bacterium]|nr:hypothetical protein [Acidimicrobiia bacterium]